MPQIKFTKILENIIWYTRGIS